MDPNAALDELRALAAEQNAAPVRSQADEAATAARMADLFQALDQWISRGGFLPVAWKLAQDFHQASETTKAAQATKWTPPAPPVTETPAAIYAISKTTRHAIRGTSETVLGVAEIMDGSWYRDSTGRLQFEYSGETDVCWDAQTTDEEPDGRRKFVDIDGNTIAEDDIELIEDSNQEQPGEEE